MTTKVPISVISDFDVYALRPGLTAEQFIAYKNEFIQILIEFTKLQNTVVIKKQIALHKESRQPIRLQAGVRIILPTNNKYNTEILKQHVERKKEMKKSSALFSI